MNDIEAWEAHYEPNAEWACRCDDCAPENTQALFEDYQGSLLEELGEIGDEWEAGE
jgi:hypothetical protein